MKVALASIPNPSKKLLEVKKVVKGSCRLNSMPLMDAESAFRVFSRDRNSKAMSL